MQYFLICTRMASLYTEVGVHIVEIFFFISNSFKMSIMGNCYKLWFHQIVFLAQTLNCEIESQQSKVG